MSGIHADGNNEHAAGQPKHEVSPYGKRMYAIRDLLIKKGILTNGDIQRQIDYIDARGAANGARLIAKAWTDAGFKERLLHDPKSACSELGIDASGLNEFVVLENTDEVRHLVVCTLCSCYPRAILGRPPDWYKSLNYRSRAVSEPRAVMREFGHDVPDDASVQVHDSSANVRYLVIPRRPSGTEDMREEDLAGLVTRDSLIGAGEAHPVAS